MTQFYFQQGVAPGGSGSISSPWDLAGFNAAITSGVFRVGGADAIAILFGGTNTLLISAANANRTPITGSGGAATVQLTNTIFENSVNIDLTQISGISNALINATGAGYFSISTGSRLTLNAVQATGLSITGFGSVAVSNLQSTLAADLSNISTSVFTASAALSADATFTGRLGKAALSLSSASGTRTFTVNTANLRSAGGSITVGSGVNLASTAGQLQQLSAATITTSGTGSITLANLVGTGTADLSSITGNVIATIAADSTLAQGINLGTIRPTINSGARLTLADNANNNFNSAQFNGAGAVTYVDSTVTALPIVNLSVFTTGANFLTSATATTKVINTGSGVDSITTGNAADSITSGAGNDIIDAGTGNNVIRAGAGNDSVTTGAANDYVEGGGGADTINAGDGLNFITDSGGNDSITTGNDSDTILSGADNDIISSFNGADSIGAGSGTDSITAGAGNDTIVAGGGNDTINGGTGADALLGGDGNDLFVYSEAVEAGETLNGEAGSNAIRVAATTNFTALTTATIRTAGNIQEVRITGTQTGQFTGAQLTGQVINITQDDIAPGNATLLTNVTGTTAVNFSALTFVQGGGGIAFAAGDAVTFTGDGANNNITGTSFGATFTTDAGNDTVTAGAGNDTITGEAGDDRINVGAGTNTVTAGAGLDIITVDGALAGNTNTVNLSGADATNLTTVVVTSGDERSTTIETSNAGTTNQQATAAGSTRGVIMTVRGGVDSGNFTGGVGNDLLSGGAVVDTLSGGDGNDTITGGTGADIINAGAGNNVLNDIGAGGAVDVVVNNVGATMTATATGAFTAGAGTINNAANTAFVINVASAGAVDLTNAGTVNGYTVLSTGNSAVTGSVQADFLTNTSTSATFTGLAGIDTFRATADTMTITDLGAGAVNDVLIATGTAAVIATVTGNYVAGATNSNTSAGAVGLTGNFNMNMTAAVGTAGYSLTGVAAANTLIGSTFADTITGADGADNLTGNGGADRFVYASAAQSAASTAADTTRTFDSITDFAGAVGDNINLDAVGVNFAGNATATVVALAVNNVADFAALGAALIAANGGAGLSVSTTTSAAVYDITLTGTGLAAAGITRLGFVNDGTAGYANTDLLVQLQNGAAALAAGNFTFTA